MASHSPLNNTPNAMECFPMSPIQRHESRMRSFSFRANVIYAAKIHNGRIVNIQGLFTKHKGKGKVHPRIDNEGARWGG